MNVLHRDERILVGDKPSGIASHRGWATDDDTAADRARELVGAPVHLLGRLDRGASGTIVFALTPELAAALVESKTYLAIVRGAPADEEGVIDHDLDGKPATTAWRRVAISKELVEGRRYALVEARPRTGRTHQVRRHLKHLGHPLVGDVNHGRGEINRLFRARFGFQRLALHAAAVDVDGHRITAPLPAELAALLAALF